MIFTTPDGRVMDSKTIVGATTTRVSSTVEGENSTNQNRRMAIDPPSASDSTESTTLSETPIDIKPPQFRKTTATTASTGSLSNSHQQNQVPSKCKHRLTLFLIVMSVVVGVVIIFTGVYCGTTKCSMMSSNKNSDSFRICTIRYDNVGNVYGTFMGKIYFDDGRQSYTIQIDYNETGIYEETMDVCPQNKRSTAVVKKGYIQYSSGDVSDGTPNTCSSGGTTTLTLDYSANGLWEYEWIVDDGSGRVDTGYLTLVDNCGSEFDSSSLPMDSSSTSSVVAPTYAPNAIPSHSPSAETSVTCPCELLQDSVGNPYGVFTGEILNLYTIKIYYNESGIYEETPGICPLAKGGITILEKGYMQYVPKNVTNGQCVTDGITDLRYDPSTTTSNTWVYQWIMHGSTRKNVGIVQFDCELTCRRRHHHHHRHRFI